VSDGKRAELFRRAAVVVLPYIEASQSGIIPIAYRFRKPVIATTVGGLPAAVEHGRTGYLVPPRDVNALADAIVTLLRNRELRAEFGLRGHEKINHEANPTLIARKTMAAYRRALGLTGGREARAVMS
jgi:glycosyltransferase involved in cell wall biosynthesis